MKTKRIIFIWLGWLFILVNIMGYIGALGKSGPFFEDRGLPFIFGFNFWFVSGIVFLLLANKQKRKMKRAKEKEELDNFLVEKVVENTNE